VKTGGDTQRKLSGEVAKILFLTAFFTRDCIKRKAK